ncbi:hypothetical protein BVX98_00710, partial [bacterium F11]
VVDEANGVTLIMKDGKQVHHLTYKVRNTWKQFLELQLPEGAQVWSAFVEGQRVKPSKNADGNVLVPLNRSKTEGRDLKSFDVEVMYYVGNQKLSPVGHSNLMFPVPDLVVSQMLWSVYLPVDYDYLYFGGTVDKERQASGLKPLATVFKGNQQVLGNLVNEVSDEMYNTREPLSDDVRRKRESKVRRSKLWGKRGRFDKSQGISDDTYARQVEREFNFFNQLKQEAVQQGGARDPGVIPIRVAVPPSGKVFRFTKQIVIDQDTLNLNVVYTHKWLIRLVKLLIFVLFVFILIRCKNIFQRTMEWIRLTIKKNEKSLQWASSPMGLVIVATLCLILFSFVSRLLTVIAFLTLMGALVRWGWIKLKTKRSQP